MAGLGRIAAVSIDLSDAERAEIEGLSRRRKTAQGLARRARIVLLAAEGLLNKDIARHLGTDPNTVSKWRRRFAERRCDGLYDEPRPGTPRQIGDDAIAETIRKTLEETPLCRRIRAQPKRSLIWSGAWLLLPSAPLLQTVFQQWPRTGRTVPHPEPGSDCNHCSSLTVAAQHFPRSWLLRLRLSNLSPVYNGKLAPSRQHVCDVCNTLAEKSFQDCATK